MGDSRPFRPSCSHFFFSLSIYGQPQKMTHQFSEPLSILLKFTFTFTEILWWKKIWNYNFIMSRALFWVAQPKQKKIKMIFLPTLLKSQHFLCEHLLNKVFSHHNFKKKFFLMSFSFFQFFSFKIISHHYF